MSEIKSGLAFHVHDNIFYELCYDYDERVKVIRQTKPQTEQPLRLKLLQLIPEDKIPSKDSLQWEAYNKVKAYAKVKKAYTKAKKAYNKIETYDKTWETYNKAREIYDKAREIYDKAYSSEIEKLHAELCPDCPWDGKTIFTRKDKDGNWY